MVTRQDNVANIPSVEATGTTVRYNETEVQALVDRYLETLHIDKRTPASGATISDFFEMVQTVIISKQNQEGVPESKRILVLEEDPPETIDTESITYYLRGRDPGSFAQGPAGTKSIQEVTPHYRAIIDHPEAPSQKLVTAGRFYDNYITFNVYARTHKAAMNRLFWFERTMDIYNWYFRLYGFRVIEQYVESRQRVKIDELMITKYPITYAVRTDDTFHFSSQELREIIIKTELSN